jgi:hypothetical protein
MGVIARLLGGISVGFMPYVLGGAVLALVAQYGYFQWQLHEQHDAVWNAATLAQAKADSETIGTQKTLATVARSEANACWDAVGQQNAAKAKVASTTDKVQSAVAASLRADAEKQRIAAARAKAQAEQAQIEADHWRNVAATSPKDQTREQACAQAESILDENLKRRRTP